MNMLEAGFINLYGLKNRACGSFPVLLPIRGDTPFQNGMDISPIIFFNPD
jgi:hypothetical protein